MEQPNNSTKHTADESEHVVHMWQPMKFKVNRGYDYLRNGKRKRIRTESLRKIIHPVLWAINRPAFGFCIKDKENLKKIEHTGCVTICNHTHQMDCTMVELALRKRRMYYVTLDSNFKIPVVRHLIRVLSAVPICSDYHCTRELFDKIEEALKSGSCVQIYPEGVLIPYCDHLRTFKDGAFRLAVKSDVPVLPLVIKQTRPRGVYRLYKRKPCMQLKILPPVYPSQSEGKRKATQILKNQCIKAMREEMEKKA